MIRLCPGGRWSFNVKLRVCRVRILHCGGSSHGRHGRKRRRACTSDSWTLCLRLGSWACTKTYNDPVGQNRRRWRCGSQFLYLFDTSSAKIVSLPFALPLLLPTLIASALFAEEASVGVSNGTEPPLCRSCAPPRLEVGGQPPKHSSSVEHHFSTVDCSDFVLHDRTINYFVN